MASEDDDKRKRQEERARSHPLRIEILALSRTRFRGDFDLPQF
jgi:hypothetical protein